MATASLYRVGEVMVLSIHVQSPDGVLDGVYLVTWGGYSMPINKFLDY